jgi:hypothetical protein
LDALSASTYDAIFKPVSSSMHAVQPPAGWQINPPPHIQTPSQPLVQLFQLPADMMTHGSWQPIIHANVLCVVAELCRMLAGCGQQTNMLL